MKEGLNDKILARILDLNNKSIAKIRENLKGTKPFASKPIPPEDLILAKATIGYMDLLDLNREYGQEAVNRLMFEISGMENRRKKSGTIKEEPTKPPFSPPVEGEREFPI